MIDGPPLPGADLLSFQGPIALAQRGLVLPPSPGAYVIASGICVSHIGTSGSLRGRVSSLARLGTHRGSAEVLCGAYCTGEPPLVWWLSIDKAAAIMLERAMKAQHGEPPVPRGFHSGCVNGGRLRDDLIEAAGTESWEAGYVEAVFAIGEKLRLLFQPRLHPIWRQVGVPPGPWADLIAP